ncbi:MAG TPA: DNA topoisomerase IB, partial [Polyangiaceae bacterium]|nr:DNA topoisomerase IB [Polyangiaceae bacterium]
MSETQRPHVLLRDSQAAASAASLRYVCAEELEILRERKGRGFVYRGPNGRVIKNAKVLARIRQLALPPAWKQVRISMRDDGHLQAIGIDAKGRKQYRYHPAWRQVRDLAKYDNIVRFVRALPRLRERLSQDLKQRALSKTKVVAAVVSLMERTQLRVGNRRYAEQNGSYGLTTLRDEHARISGASLTLRFRGKSGKQFDVNLHDRRLAKIVRKCRDIPGQTLFQYFDEDGQHHAVTSCDVNAYLQETMGHAFTAKEFRTWAASSLAALHLASSLPFGSQTAAKRMLVAAAKMVASELGNTPAICRKCYIHPGIFDCYLRGQLHESLDALLSRARKRRP